MEPLSSEDIAEIEAALAAQEKALINLKGKYIKHVLSRLEQLNMLNKDIRKVILDGFNDLTRDNLLLLGFTVDE